MKKEHTTKFARDADYFYFYFIFFIFYAEKYIFKIFEKCIDLIMKIVEI